MTQTDTPTTEQRYARIILARLAHRGPSTAAQLAGGGVPGVGSKSFAQAFALLTRGELVRCSASRPGGRNAQVPVFEVTLEGRNLAHHLPPPL